MNQQWNVAPITRETGINGVLNFAQQKELFDPVLAKQIATYDNETDAFIYDKAAPRAMVDTLTGERPVYDENALYKRYDDYISEEESISEVSWGWSSDSYSCAGHGLGVFYEDVKIQDLTRRMGWTEAQLWQWEAYRLQRHLMINREIRLNTKLTTTGTYASGFYNQLTTTSRWYAAPNTANPKGDVITAAKTLLGTYNTIILGAGYYYALLQSPAVKEISVGIQQNGMPSLETLKAFFECDNIIVGMAKYDSQSEKKGNPSMGYIHDKFCVVCHLDPSSNPFTKTFLQSLEFRNSKMPMVQGGFSVKRYRIEDRGTGGWKQVVINHVTEFVPFQKLGYLIYE